LICQTLREELRKVQSSITLLERQRSPGIGYWSPRPDESAPGEPRTSIQSDSTSRAGSPAPAQGAVSAKKEEEEINIEYLRNVILQFLEHKEMRVSFFATTVLRKTPLIDIATSAKSRSSHVHFIAIDASGD
jgi:hypothetical protein